MKNDTMNRFLRSLLQVIVAGGATAVFDAVTNLVPVQYQALVAACFYLIIVLAQNFLENEGIIPTILKPAPMTIELVRDPENSNRV